MEQEQFKFRPAVRELVKGHFPGLNVLEQRNYSQKVQGVLQDPFLWIRLKYGAPVSDEKLHSLDKLNKAGDVEPVLRKRVHLCGFSLSLSSETNPPDRLAQFFANSKKVTEEDLGSVLFPDEIFSRLPDVLSEARTEEEVREKGDVTKGRGPARGTQGVALKGMVTDLYSCPDDGWEGYIWRFYDPMRSRRWEPVYRFTLSSCSSAFPIYLGAIAEFYPSYGNSSETADGSLRLLEYWPDTLPEEFAKKHLEKLEKVQSPSDCSQQVRDLPGPFHSLMNEGRFYNAHQSNVLAVLSCITREGVGNSQDILYMFHTSKFIQELPQILAQSGGKQGSSHAPACVQYESDVHTLTHLVALCIQSFPKEAFELVPVIQDCIKLVMTPTDGSRFKAEAVVLSHAIVNACSQARCSEVVQSSTGLASMKKESNENEAGVTAVDQLLDPLWWVRFFYHDTAAQPLLQFLHHTPLQQDMGVVVARKKAEMSIIQSLETAAAKQQEKHQPKSKLPLVKKAIVEGASGRDPSLAIRHGIIIDLYEDGVGYIALAHSQEFLGRKSKNRVFEIMYDPQKIPSIPVTVHIGDVVEFEVSPDTQDTASKIVKVIKYCPEALDVEFALDILSPQNASSKHGVFRNETAWRAILNAPSVYKDVDVCSKILNMAVRSLSGDSSSTPSTRNRVLSLLQSSSFIRDLMEFAPEEVSTSINILMEYLQLFPNEVCTLQQELRDIVTYLSEHNMLQELTILAGFLTSSSCIVPPSVELSRQPWQSIPVILTREEFHAKTAEGSPSEVSLPEVKALGKYSSVHEYGRTYFMLLRADCYGDLLTAISHFKPSTAPKRNNAQLQAPCYDAKLLTISSDSRYHLVYKLNLELKPLPGTDLEISLSEFPLLKSGNLLCLSVGGRFEDDIVWATINHVKTFKVTQEEGIRSWDVLVQFCTESNSCSDEEVMQRLKASENVVAVESPAYFRAYQPVLQVLKEMDLEQIHFLPDLLNPGSKPKAPLAVLRDDIVVTDIADLYRQEARSEAPRELTLKELIDVLKREDPKLCLHRFQQKAVRQALTQSLTLIQGPPGTGKSYLGLRLLQLFLSMRQSGKLLLDEKPVLVMAYKNRALDHFIHECRMFCRLDDIVRIGHASEGYEKLLKPVLLGERVMDTLPKEGTITFREALGTLHERVREACEELAAVSDLCSLETCIPSLSPDWLQSLILEDNTSAEQLGRAPEVLKTDPEGCLRLLQATHSLGKKDRELKKKIRTFLEKSWDKWVADIGHYSKSAKILPPKNTADEESETDHDALQTERLMAQDKYNLDYSPKKEILIPALFEKDNNGDSAMDESHVWDLLPGNRKQLIVYALQDRYEQALERLKECVREYNLMREKYELRWQQAALRVLKQAKVVAMTTTGAAIHQQLLNKLEAPVVLVEEAAEILESNLLATLTPHVKHLVLLGDHKQLRPNLACSKLRENKFDLSLFERLINNQYPHTLLLRQNRMHPHLVSLYKYHYLGEDGKISSSERTKKYLKPDCMGTSFFWWSYSGKYEKRTGSSQSNDYEIEMVVSLCSWLVCNGVNAKGIAVLTPYRGQLEEIKRNKGLPQMPTALLDIDVYTMDEYQGHESDVVILSLVRSNKARKIGFLKEENRLVVGSSRQKSALYIVGNSSFLKDNSPVVWKKFIEKCESKYSGQIGTGLPIMVGGNEQVCEAPEDLDKRTAQILEVANNNTADTEPSPSVSEPSESAEIAPVAESLPRPATPPQEPVPRQQSSPASFHVEPHQSEEASTTTQGDVDDASVSSTTTRKEDLFRKCILKIKGTAAAKKWKHIARHLEVADSAIDQLQHNFGTDLPEVFYQMIRKWKETKGKHATYNDLIEALKAEDLNSVADTVEKYKQQDADIVD